MSLPTCIVADDHPAVREAIVMRMEDEASVAVVATAADGVETLELIREHAPDVAMVDLRMPAATGIDVARAVRSESGSTRVIIVSACIDAAVVEAARAAGAAGYIAKDASGSTFAETVATVLAGTAFVDATGSR